MLTLREDINPEQIEINRHFTESNKCSEYNFQSLNLMNLSRVSNPPKTGFNEAPS